VTYATDVILLGQLKQRVFNEMGIQSGGKRICAEFLWGICTDKIEKEMFQMNPKEHFLG
jgi:hypothetical protein